MNQDPGEILTALTYVQDWLDSRHLAPALLIYAPPPTILPSPPHPFYDYLRFSDQLPHWACAHHLSPKQLNALEHITGRTL
jgi:hypothetical protein